MSDVPLVLASASPRRAELLRRIGLDPTVVAADVDESVLPGESPRDYVMRVAADKAHAIAQARPEQVTLAADTAVVVDDEALGKPADAEDAVAMLERLSGRTHRVLTAVVVVDPEGIEHSAVASATVTMAHTSDAERAWYVGTGEPMDKAGAYAVQGIGAAFVEQVEGDPTTVIGLPLRTTVELLRVAGVTWPPRP
ncbi:MAG: Maf family protein [Microthrixaceae bacterium]